MWTHRSVTDRLSPPILQHACVRPRTPLADATRIWCSASRHRRSLLTHWLLTCTPTQALIFRPSWLLASAPPTAHWPPLSPPRSAVGRCRGPPQLSHRQATFGQRPSASQLAQSPTLPPKLTNCYLPACAPTRRCAGA
jgi:hypothetical protein